MSLSQRAWRESAAIIEAIKEHPFNQGLMDGTLPLDIFGYYIEQDSDYLIEFARCLAFAAAKAPNPSYIESMLDHAKGALIAEREMVHQFFIREFGLEGTGHITMAAMAYKGHLIHSCSVHDFSICIAALLPCFWVYKEVGAYIAENAACLIDGNKYGRWIETYIDKKFTDAVDEMIEIFDAIGDSASDATQDKMINAFIKSAALEFHFWDDAYNCNSPKFL